MAGVDGITGDPTVVTAAGTGPQAAGAPPLVVDGEVQIQATLTAVADGEDAENTVRAVRDAVHAAPRTAARSWSAAPPRSSSTPSTPRPATCG